MTTTRTKSADDTRALAGRLAALARPGDVVLLAGDLGTGKTTFAQGFGRALGIEEPIVSPTFTLVREYTGRHHLVHADVYRLDQLQEIIDLGLPEMLDDGSIALIEWGDMAAPALPADYLEVRLGYLDDDEARSLGLRVVGPAWSARDRAVRAAVADWTMP